MPAFNTYDQTEAKFDSGFSQPEPGRYILRVVAVRTEWEEYDYQTGLRKQCNTASEAAVIFVYDIADGQFAGEYTRDFYLKNGMLDEKKDWLHQYKFQWGDLSNPKDAARAKWTIDSFAQPGFDPLAAFKADAWNLFIGHTFGAVLNGTIKTNDQGYDNWNLKPQRKIYSVQEIQSGVDRDGKELPEPKITDKRANVGSSSTGASGGQVEQVPADVYDIPFDV